MVTVWLTVCISTRLQNSFFLRREIENPGAFIKWKTEKRKWTRERERKGMGRGAKEETVLHSTFQHTKE